MEWFWALVERFQKGVAGSALQHFSVIDWIFVCVILWGLIQGGRKGFTDMFGKLLGIFLVSMLTLSFYEFGAENLTALSIRFSNTCLRRFESPQTRISGPSLVSSTRIDSCCLAIVSPRSSSSWSEMLCRCTFTGLA